MECAPWQEQGSITDAEGSKDLATAECSTSCVELAAVELGSSKWQGEQPQHGNSSSSSSSSGLLLEAVAVPDGDFLALAAAQEVFDAAGAETPAAAATREAVIGMCSRASSAGAVAARCCSSNRSWSSTSSSSNKSRTGSIKICQGSSNVTVTAGATIAAQAAPPRPEAAAASLRFHAIGAASCINAGGGCLRAPSSACTSAGPKLPVVNKMEQLASAEPAPYCLVPDELYCHLEQSADQSATSLLQDQQQPQAQLAGEISSSSSSSDSKSSHDGSYSNRKRSSSSCAEKCCDRMAGCVTDATLQNPLSGRVSCCGEMQREVCPVSAVTASDGEQHRAAARRTVSARPCGSCCAVRMPSSGSQFRVQGVRSGGASGSSSQPRVQCASSSGSTSRSKYRTSAATNRSCTCRSSNVLGKHEISAAVTGSSSPGALCSKRGSKRNVYEHNGRVVGIRDNGKGRGTSNMSAGGIVPLASLPAAVAVKGKDALVVARSRPAGVGMSGGRTAHQAPVRKQLQRSSSHSISASPATAAAADLLSKQEHVAGSSRAAAVVGPWTLKEQSRYRSSTTGGSSMEMGKQKQKKNLRCGKEEVPLEVQQ